MEANKRRSGIRKRLQLIKVITPSVLNQISWHGAVCSCSCFCIQQEFEYPVNYRAGTSKISTFTKSHVPKWFTQEGNKQKAACQSRRFSQQNVVLSSYQALNCADLKIEWCGNWIITVTFCSTTSSLKRRRSRHLLYLTLLVYLQHWFWIHMPRTDREKAGSFSKLWRRKLQVLYTQGGAVFGSVRNLVKASNPPVSNVRQFLHSKHSYTKFAPATRKFRRIKAFARFRSELWCMDLAYVNKLAKERCNVRCKVRQDVFDRTVDAKGMKTEGPEKWFVHFWSWLQKRIDPGKFGSTREQNLLESLLNFAKLNEDKFTLQWVRLRLHFLNVQNAPRKMFLAVHKRLRTQVHSQIVSIGHNPVFPNKMFERFDTKEYQELRLYVHSVQQATKRI